MTKREELLKEYKKADKIEIETYWVDVPEGLGEGIREGDRVISLYFGDKVLEMLPPRLCELSGEELEDYKYIYNNLIDRSEKGTNKDIYNKLRDRYPNQPWCEWERLKKEPKEYLSLVLWGEKARKVDDAEEHQEAWSFIYEESDKISHDLNQKVYKYIEARDKALIKAMMELVEG